MSQIVNHQPQTGGAISMVEKLGIAPTSSLGGIRRKHGDENAKQVIAEEITRAALLLNVGKNMRAEQVYPVAELILDEFKLLTVSDVKTALRKGITGKYGTTYDRLDVQVISVWLERYQVEKIEAAEANANLQHERNKQQAADVTATGGPMPEWFKAWMNKGVFKSADEPKPEYDPAQDAALIETLRLEYETKKPQCSFDTYKDFRILQIKAGK